MTFEELDALLERAEDYALFDNPANPDNDVAAAIKEARVRLARRRDERSVMMVVCQKCLKQGASVKLQLQADGESLHCPVHGAA